MSAEPTNIMILLDATERMGKNDFKPNRFLVALKGIQLFIEEKHIQNPNILYSIFIIRKQTVVLATLSKDIKYLIKKVSSKKFLHDYPLSGEEQDILYGLEAAVEEMCNQIGQFAHQNNRITIFTAGFNFQNNSEFKSIIQKSSELKIQLDIILLNPNLTESDKNYYGSIIRQTEGLFFHFAKKKQFLQEIKILAQTALKGVSRIRLEAPSKKNHVNHIQELAKSLRYPNEAERIKIADRHSSEKCQICFSKKSPIDGNHIKKTGRYCPNCNTLFHIHCAGLWALKSHEGKNVFRCPFCYTLLKINPIIINGLKIREKSESMEFNLKKKSKIRNNKAFSPHQFHIKMLRVKDPEILGEKGYQESTKECSYCFLPLLSSTGTNNEIMSEYPKFFKCSKCGAIYHESCLEEMYKKFKVCRNCGGLN